jgi:hypothetical protein
MPKTSIDSNSGIFIRDILQCNALFIGGKRFQDFINELVFEDQFEQAEITEIKLLLQYLNTSGLSSEWIIDNNNKNQDLKTAITALQTKTGLLDTTGLTQSWIINDLNRNATLKTAIDLINTRLLHIDTTSLSQTSILTNDNRNSVLLSAINSLTSSVGTNNGKLRYVSSTQGTNSPDTFSDFIVDVGDRTLNKVLLQTANGANMIAMVTNTSTLQGQNDYPNNRILLNAPVGRIQMDCKNLQLQSPLIEIGSDFAIGGACEIRLGTKRANIKIGSHQSPDFNEPTIITIGNRSVTQNTHTNLEGNIYTGEARFESLSKSQALTLGALLSIITSSGLPLYINIFTALSLSSYVHSDLWGLAGSVVKNGDVATTNDIKVKTYSLYNTDVNLVDLFPVENTFIASGSSSKTLLLGSIKEQVFKNGSDITLRHNNILATNINWALSEANDNVNALCIKGNDGILLHQGASSVGASMKILNSNSGKIELLIGNAGTQASCLTGLTVDWNSGQPQVICGTKGGLQNIQQTKSKLLVQQSDTAGDVGIEVVKNGISPANAPLNRTTISDNNVDTHSLSLKTNFTGTTTKALYLDAGDNLRYNGNLVTPVQNVVGSQFINVINNNGTYTIERDSDNLIAQSLQLYSNYTGQTARILYLDAGDNLKFAGNLVTPVKDIVAGAHISVTNNDGVYTIARTGGGGGGSVADVGEDLVISATATQIPRKSGWYGQSFVRFSPISRMFFDVYMSGNGKYIYWANRATNESAATILSSANYANDSYFTQSNVSKLWITICGTSEGNRVFACGSNEIWANTTPSTTWTQSTTPPNFAGAMPVQMRCSGDGKYQLITDARQGSWGAIYKSNDYGATWTQQNITGIPSRPLGCCINASGKTQYVVLDGTNNGQNAENGAGGLFRSQDFGASWVKVIGTPNGQHQRVSCDATGRYLGLVGSFSLYTSKDYGATWVTHSILDSYSIYVSHTGDFMWMGRNASSNNYYFSTDYGNTFTLANTSPDGSYQGMNNACIACNNDGSIVVSGSINGYYINSCRENSSEVRVLTTQGNSGINITDLGNGAYQLESSNPKRLHLAYNYALNSGIGTRSVFFNLGATYNLANYRMKGKIHLSVDVNFDYGAIRFNGLGTLGDSNQSQESTWNNIREYVGGNNGFETLRLDGYLSRDPIFAHLNTADYPVSILLSFEIDLMRQVAPRQSILVCRGTVSYGFKQTFQGFAYRVIAEFERYSTASDLYQISIDNWGTTNSINYATLDLEIIAIPPQTAI